MKQAKKIRNLFKWIIQAVLFLSLFQLFVIVAVIENLSFIQEEKRLSNYGLNKQKRESSNTIGREQNGFEVNTEDKVKRMLELSGVVITPEIEDKLPTWEEVVSLYGPKPILYGFESACPNFKQTVPASDPYIAPAGIFNTGTNLLPHILNDYCEMPSRTNPLESDLLYEGNLLNAPWGKHNPVSWRNQNVAPKAEGMIQNHTLPVIVIKDPYFWMGSMCRHWYQAKWEDADRCPNLVEVEGDTIETYPVRIQYKKDEPPIEYESLVDVWNTWYGDYIAREDDFPMIMIRYEDLLFHTEEVITKVCECGGGVLTEEAKGDGIQLRVGSAKRRDDLSHEGSGGLVSSIIRYGDLSKRLEDMNEHDLRFARENIRTDLMKIFGYSFP